MRFLDKAGPRAGCADEPRSLITAVMYRPRTSDEDRPALHYTSSDLDGFKKDVLREQLGDAMRELREGRGVDEDRIYYLARRVEEHCERAAVH